MNTLQILQEIDQTKISHSVTFAGAHTVPQGGVIEMGVTAEVVNEAFFNPHKYIFLLYVIDREAYEELQKQ
jgi:hypothetical protein